MVIVVVEGIDQGCTTSTVHSNCTVVNKKTMDCYSKKGRNVFILEQKGAFFILKTLDRVDACFISHLDISA